MVPVELVRFLTQRVVLHRTPGLRFARVLGSARGRSMSLSADLTRWALFAVWDDDAALDRFIDDSPISAHWRRYAIETWTVGLVPLAAHGAWDGNNPLGQRHEPTDQESPLAVLTRAKVRARRWPRFYRAAAVTEHLLADASGLLASIGVGERPIGRQATFSVWHSAADISAFAYRSAEHTEIIRRTRDENWYAEELFARFRVYRSAGTWDGSDPVDGIGDLRSG